MLTFGAATENEDVPGNAPGSGVPASPVAAFDFRGRLRVGGVSGLTSPAM